MHFGNKPKISLSFGYKPTVRLCYGLNLKVRLRFGHNPSVRFRLDGRVAPVVRGTVGTAHDCNLDFISQFFGGADVHTL